MSVNIVQNGELLPIAGKTVPAPTPDYVDEQFNPSTTYSKGMTCISGNVRYEYINNTPSSGHTPPDVTYWKVKSVATQMQQGFNLSVFADNANFTAPTPGANRCTIVSGGYKQVGKIVYIYVKIKPGSDTSFWTNGGGGGIFTGMPKAAFNNQVTIFPFYYVPYFGTLNFYIVNDANNQGQVSMSCNQSSSMTLTGEIILQGIYLAD